VSNLSNFEDMKSESAKSYMMRSNRAVADRGLRKLLADPNISESERITAVKMRTQQIEQRAQMEEQKLRLMGKSDANNYGMIEQSIAVNDIYIDSIQAKLNILEKI